MKNTTNRYVIQAKTPEYYRAVKKLFNSDINRPQLHAILKVTKGSVVGLRIGRYAGSKKLWFAFDGYRYDVQPDGAMSEKVRLGNPRPPSVPMAKNITCGLCGKETPVAHFEMAARCPCCGKKLVRYNVIRRK